MRVAYERSGLPGVFSSGDISNIKRSKLDDVEYFGFGRVFEQPEKFRELLPDAEERINEIDAEIAELRKRIEGLEDYKQLYVARAFAAGRPVEAKTLRSAAKKRRG